MAHKKSHNNFIISITYKQLAPNHVVQSLKEHLPFALSPDFISHISSPRAMMAGEFFLLNSPVILD